MTIPVTTLTSETIQYIWADRSGCPPWPHKQAKLYLNNNIEYGSIDIRHCDSPGELILQAVTNDAEYEAAFDETSTSRVHVRASNDVTGTIEPVPPPKIGMATISYYFPAKYRCVFRHFNSQRSVVYICDRDRKNNRYILKRDDVEVATIPLLPRGEFRRITHIIIYLITFGRVKTTLSPIFPAVASYHGAEEDTIPVFAVWLVVSVAIGGGLFGDSG